MPETDKQAAVDELRRLEKTGLQMGGEDRIAGQHQRGRLTARERIDKLLDPASFAEMDALMQNAAPDSEGRTTHISTITPAESSR